MRRRHRMGTSATPACDGSLVVPRSRRQTCAWARCKVNMTSDILFSRRARAAGLAGFPAVVSPDLCRTGPRRGSYNGSLPCESLQTIRAVQGSGSTRCWDWYLNMMPRRLRLANGGSRPLFPHTCLQAVGLPSLGRNPSDARYPSMVRRGNG